MAAQEPLSFYQRAIEWSHKADKLINLLLSYALALSSLIAYLDVLGNGGILDRVPTLFYVWLSVQGLGVELQILIVLSRLPELMQIQGAWKRACLIAFNVAFIVLLAYLSIIIGAIFTEHGDARGTVSQAMQVLGVNATAFVYERAEMATFLLILMGVDRMMERWRISRHPEHTADREAEPATPPPADYAHLASALLPILSKTLLPVLQQQVRRGQIIVTEEVGVDPQQLAQGPEPAGEHAGTDDGHHREPEPHEEAVPVQGGERSGGERERAPSRVHHAGTAQEKLARAYQELKTEQSKITGETLSKRAGTRKATALTWLKTHGTQEEQEHGES